ncbi:MAG: hypothetical protein C0517_11260 [Erythrobacter sp.]|nr:hypothetical protein [Erythrobacter sp.]
MYSRIFSAVALILLAACGAESPPPPGVTVDCAIGAGADLSPVCTLELVTGTPDMVIHHPDGGFRRFRIANGAIVATDGAAAVEVLTDISHAHVEIAVDGDRYRIPNSPENRN